jgi:PAS domain S-box-containing protein
MTPKITNIPESGQFIRSEAVAPSARGKILVVDDNAAMLKATVRILEHGGYEVTQAIDGAEALRQVRALRPDLVLLDVMLPDISGPEIVRQMRAEPELADISLVLLSSQQTGPEQQSSGLDAGADGYIARPIANQELLARVRSHLRQRELTCQLHASEARFRDLIAQQHDSVVVVSRDGIIQFANPAAGKLFGRPAAELVGRPFGFSIEEGGVQEITPHRPDGKIAVAEMRTGSTEWNGQPAWVAAIRDITERSQAEETLRLQNAALEAVANAIVITDQSGNILRVNAAFTAMTGYTAQEVVGKNPRILKSGKQDEVFYRNLWQTISSGQVWKGELTNRRKDGSLYVEELTITPLRNADGVIARYIAIKQDITERKEAENLVRLSQERYHNLIDNARDAIFTIASDGTFTSLNPVVETITGLSRADWIGKPFVPMVHPDDRPLAREMFSRVLKDENPPVHELRSNPSLSRPILMEMTLAALKDESGKITGVFGIGRDVTERKQDELRLQQSERRMRAITDSAQDAILMMDPEGRISYWNPAAEHILGYTGAEALGQNLHDLIAPACFHPAHHAAYPAFLQTGQGAAVGKTVDLEARRKDGREISVQLSLSAIQMNEGWHAVGIIRDITERKRDEEALRATKLQLAHAMSLAQLVAWEYDVASGLFTFSDSYYALHGTTAKLENGNLMSAGDFTRKYMYPDDAHLVAEETGKAVATADPDYHSQFEHRIFRRDGELRYVRVHISVIKDAAGRTIQIQGANQDITESKRAQVELEHLQKQLVEASRLGGMAEIATNVLHNVGNTLNSVNISTDLIIESVKQSKTSSLARVVALLEEHAQDLGEFITHDPGGRHVPAVLARLSEHLLAEQTKIVGELDSLRQNVEHIKEIVAMQQSYAMVGGMKEMIDVVSLVEDSLRLNEYALKRHGVEVVRELQKAPLMNIEKHKILQILVNLVRNAKYACDDSKRADKRLTVRMTNGDGWIRISVIDNGIGIPPENLTRIFNYGFTTRKGGHGFGLHGSALAAEEMGGSLTARSGGPGQGADFTLELPCPTQENTHE